MKTISRIARTLLLPVLLLAGAEAKAENLIPAKVFNTSDWTSGNGFQACSGGSGYKPCVDGNGALVFSYDYTVVSRSFAIGSPVSSVSFLVNAFSSWGTDPGEVYLRAFNAGNQKLAEATFSSNALDLTIQPVKLVLSDAGVLATATRIEVVVGGDDTSQWVGNYGSAFSEPQLFINDMDGDGLEDSLDADVDGDGTIERMQVSARGYSTCALDNTGVHCWGDVSTGQSQIPALVQPASVSAGLHVCAQDVTGVHCWGNNGNGQTNVPVLDNPRAVSAGGFHTCALDDAGVYCWGYNYNGQATVPPLDNPVAIDAGYLYTCALDADGVHCWGQNDYGQATVPPLDDPVAVSTGLSHTCALDTDGVHCWGGNDYGQLDVPALSNPVAVGVGNSHSCALDDTGVHCWGNNSVGQINVPTLDQPQSISVGAYHSCAVDKTGVHCWGYNSSGQSVVPAALSSVVDNCPLLANADQLDTDSDHIGNACDPDMDGDGVANASDVFPLDATETADNDNDGIGNNADTDDDNDDVPDTSDAFPFDADESADTDGDNIGNNADADDDNDGVIDTADAFPLDATETEDGDGDNLGDNSDPLPADANTLNDFLNNIKADKAGSSVAFAGDFNGDGYGDYVIGIPGYDLPATFNTKIQKDAGRAVVISGKNGHELASVAGFSAKDAMGFAVAGNGDINNDGFSDVVVGAPYTLKNAGRVTVLYGPDGTVPDGEAVDFYGELNKKALLGSAVALTDWNDDGRADIAIGIPKADESFDAIVDAGCVIVVSGNGLPPLLGADFCGSTAKAYFGTSLATGDVDGDGKPDLVIGAPNDDDVANKLKDAGSVNVYLNSGMPLQKKYGAVTKAYLGKSVGSGDVNNDGYADVLAGAPGDDKPATLSDKKMADAGSVTVFSGADNTELTKQYGATAKAVLGNSVVAGDINGDGFADIVAGATKGDTPAMPKIIKNTGSVSVWSGSNYDPVTTWYGDVPKDAFGASVAAGDVNSDGKADVIIGIPGFDIPPAPPAKMVKDTGAVTVISGDSL